MEMEVNKVFARGTLRRAWPSLVVMVLTVVGLAADATLARAQGAGGAVSGIVTDTQGGVVPGVSLTARNVGSGETRATVTDLQGRYRLAALPPGAYSLVAELSGFSTVTLDNLTLTTGAEASQDFSLKVSGVEESVSVSAVAPPIEASRADVTAVITQEQIATLPVAGRSAITLALLLPGTGNDNTRTQRPGANVGSGGITTAATNYIVDGLNNMISMAGDAREDVPQSAVQEFRVEIAQASAEFGGRSGGVVSVVTKSGTNQFSGEAFEFLRHKNLNQMNLYEQQAHDSLGTPKPKYRRDQYGISAGGPIVKNKIHFFGAIDRTRELQYFNVTTGKPEFYGAHEGLFQGGGRANLAFGKADALLGQRQRLSVRASRQDTVVYCLSCGGTSASFSSTDNEVPGFTYLVNHSAQITNRILNEFAALYAESNQRNPPGIFTPSTIDPAVGSPRYVFPSFTWGSRPGTTFRNPYYQFRNALSVSAGSHLFKFGGGAQKLPTDITTPGAELGTWTFGKDQYFNPADPTFSFANLTGATQFTASFPTFTIHLLSHTFEAYAQDSWHVTSNLTLNYGLRYDRQTKIFNEGFTQARYPKPLPYVDFAKRGDPNNIAPRAALAWDLKGDSRTVARAGFGVVFGNLQNAVARGELDAFQSSAISIRNPTYPDPYGGKSPQAFVSTAPPNIEVNDNNIENPRTQVSSVGLSQAIGPLLALHVDGIYSTTTQYPVGVQVNTADPVTGIRPLPEWGTIRLIKKVNDGSFDYRALLVRLERRFSNNYLYSLSYTLAKQDIAWRSGTHFGTQTDALHPEYDNGPTDNDRRHSFVASGSVRLPWDLVVGGVWTLRSSRPFNALAGIDLNKDGQNNDYVPGTSQNQGNRNLNLDLVNAWRATNNLKPIAASQIASDRFNRLDVRVSKSIPLGGGRKAEFIGQVFNLVGTDNLAGVGNGWVTNALSDSFGRILSAQPRRQAEVAVRVAF